MTTKIPVELSSTPGIVDGSNATAITIDSSENVGIGTASPDSTLHVKGAADAYLTLEAGATDGNTAILMQNSGGTQEAFILYDTDDNNMQFGVNSAERMRISADAKVSINTSSPAAYLDVRAPSGVAGPTVAQFKSDQHGLGLTIGVDSTATYLNSNNNSYPLVLQSGGAPVLVRTATVNGNTASMHIDANTANKFCTTISHNGNTTNRFGLQIACGTDDNSGTNTMVSFLDGNFDGVGSITASGGTVTYGAFTAHHEVNVPDSDNPSDESDAYPYGTLVEIVSTYLTDSNKRQSIRYTVQKSQSANSKKVLGAYASNMRPSPMCPSTGTYANNLHNISILGDGHVLCNNTGGNIEIGDGICTSAVEGIGMKATVNPSMIVAIAQENVTFSGSETKLVAVQFGVQQFTPWS